MFQFQIIRQFCNESIFAHYGDYPSPCALNIVWSTVVCTFILGAAVGSLGGSALAARLGRKSVLVICAALAAMAAVMFFSCKPAGSVEMLILGRLLAGLSAGRFIFGCMLIFKKDLFIIFDRYTSHFFKIY
ncbi:unnamed protein product [Acanthoscelides obtectus]|uniref:Major facilitator superfamily (MFS) profile domain-containing protein n=1 Tax=Acanthoscelides obtectus TaxID=200917 RepID=A0A9P0QFG9_ACAOB|nr:unnamed protein product [Acanthoscelides obtectus]CAK1689306.1 Solute carrier family 2, facilitated glucose transporter member 5 [Acanthoscelides obtectus]